MARVLHGLGRASRRCRPSPASVSLGHLLVAVKSEASPGRPCPPRQLATSGDACVAFGAEATHAGIKPAILGGRHRHGHGRTPFGMQSARGLLRTIPDDLPRTTFASAVAVAAIFVGMAVGSYLDLAPPLTAQGTREADVEHRADRRQPDRDYVSGTPPRRRPRWSSPSGPSCRGRRLPGTSSSAAARSPSAARTSTASSDSPRGSTGIGRASVTRTRTSRSARRWRRPAPGSTPPA